MTLRLTNFLWKARRGGSTFTNSFQFVSFHRSSALSLSGESFARKVSLRYTHELPSAGEPSECSTTLAYLLSAFCFSALAVCESRTSKRSRRLATDRKIGFIHRSECRIWSRHVCQNLSQVLDCFFFSFFSLKFIFFWRDNSASAFSKSQCRVASPRTFKK